MLHVNYEYEYCTVDYTHFRNTPAALDGAVQSAPAGDGELACGERSLLRAHTSLDYLLALKQHPNRVERSHSPPRSSRIANSYSYLLLSRRRGNGAMEKLKQNWLTNLWGIEITNFPSECEKQLEHELHPTRPLVHAYLGISVLLTSCD